MSQELNNIFSQHSTKRHIRSFYYAGRGLKHVFLNEANFRIHFLIGSLASVLAYLLHFSHIEWVLLVFAIGFVLITEIINSLIEELIDHLVQEHHESARIIKDLGAATVLTAAILSVIVGLFLFLPKILNNF